MFGYSNGTDSIIDISYYLNDNENYGINDKKFIDILYENFNIENNIFNYVSANKIKIVFIPQEIVMLNQQTGELINIDSEIYLDNNYYFKQNFNLPKTSQYYYIDYQYIIKEQNENEENERIFYGKTNRLKFKLCFEYCDTCNELGISENEQKCLSCLDDYQYNYDYYNNKIINNCVPEGYYYDNEINSLILCDSIENIKYITIDNNKRICYKDLFNNAESSNIININENINENEISKYESKSDKESETEIFHEIEEEKNLETEKEIKHGQNETDIETEKEIKHGQNEIDIETEKEKQHGQNENDKETEREY